MASPPPQPIVYPDPRTTSTAAHFRQLHVKIPTASSGRPPEEEGPTDSEIWLQKHASGFLLMCNLHPTDYMGKSILLESIDTGELVVCKQYKKVFARTLHYTTVPNELLFSTLYDARVVGTLPTEPYFPRLHAYGYYLGNAQPPPCDAATPDDAVYALYFQCYNGGTLDNLMEMFADKFNGSQVPEAFIWHVMEQLTRAVLYLQRGYTRAALADYLGMITSRPAAPVEWFPILHRGIEARNVLLHFPDGDDTADFFPQVVLEGFGNATYASTSDYASAGPLRLRPDDPLPPRAWEDNLGLGELFRRLVTAHEFPYLGAPGQRRQPDALRFDGHLSRYLPAALRLRAGEAPAYSRDLVSLLQAWEAHGHHAGDGAAHAAAYVAAPPPEFLLEQVLPLAVQKVREYRALGATALGDPKLHLDVSWARPDPEFELMPYAHPDLSEPKKIGFFMNRLWRLKLPFAPVWYAYGQAETWTLSDWTLDYYRPDTHDVNNERPGEPFVPDEYKDFGDDRDTTDCDESDDGDDDSQSARSDQFDIVSNPDEEGQGEGNGEREAGGDSGKGKHKATSNRGGGGEGEREGGSKGKGKGKGKGKAPPEELHDNEKPENPTSSGSKRSVEEPGTQPPRSPKRPRRSGGKRGSRE